MTKQEILDIMKERILILDGATGTYLQGLKLTEEDFRGVTNSAFNKTELGQQFAHHPTPLKGCNDVLCLTQPEIITRMHQAYLDAGADIIETNSFNCNCFSLADYGLEDRVYEISKAAAECAVRACKAPTQAPPCPPRGEGNELLNSPENSTNELGNTKLNKAEESSLPDNGNIIPSPWGGQGNELLNSPENSTNELGNTKLNKAEESSLPDNGNIIPSPWGGQGGALIVGSMGPTNRTLSMSSDVNNPAARDITFQQLYDTYHEQARGLMDGGADVLLIETVFDTLNAKCALKAITDLSEERGEEIPVMVSATLSDASGRTLSGQTVEAFVASMQHGNLLSIGLNCGFGAKQLLPWLRRLSEIAQCPVSVHPNAGLPNVMGGYDETPETFAEVAKQVFEEQLVNIYGGCCGTTPAHIRAIAQLRSLSPNPLPLKGKGSKMETSPICVLSGLEPLRLDKNTGFINVGERTNVAGSAKFKKLIQAKDYEAALSVARQQVENGAQVIDICMDDGLIDGVEAMTTFLNLIASEPEIARVPIMIDSSKWEILKAGLQCVQGKSIVNSISLKEGEERFLEKARYVHSMGAAAVVMLFDENGQADTYERKIAVARRAYKLLRSIGFPGEDIIFDPNVLAVATGMPEHDDYARAFIAACATIHQEMPEVHMSGGISNLSFSFRGNNTIRQAMHSVFLYHAMQAGLDMSIVNPAMTTIYSEIPEELRKAVEAVILNLPPTPSQGGGEQCTDIPKTNSERLIELAMKIKEEEEARKAGNNGASSPTPSLNDWRKGSLKDRISHAMLKGVTDYIAEDTEEAYKEAQAYLDSLPREGRGGASLAVIDNYLMPAMEQVGKLFGEGKMFLPQVVKSARVMKKAVAVLEPYMAAPPCPPRGEGNELHNSPENSTNELGNTKLYKAEEPSQSDKGNITPSPRGGQGGAVLLATVKGDVHDIGKNICGVVVQCNGYQVKDLGVMVDTNTIVDAAQTENAAIIGLSGLITPSLDEMIKVVRELQRRGMTTPVILGGATTSAIHTAVKIAPEYPDGVVVHCHAAADNPTVIRRLLSENAAEYIAEIKAQQQIIRDNYLQSAANKKPLLSLEEARQRRHVKRVGEIAIPSPEAMQPVIEDIPISKVKDLINWNFFFQAWGMHNAQCLMQNSELSGKSEEAQKLMQDAQQMLREMEVQGTIRLSVMARILPATSDKFDNINISCDDTIYHLPMPRSLKDTGKETNCLADYICRDGQDFICPFVVTAGIGLKELQEHYRRDGDEYKATMAKLLCDRLTEALAEYTEKRVGWGISSIRMAFGYGACPDHKLKKVVFDILDVKNHLPLSLTDSYMIDPGESICGLIFANTPTKYFNV